MIGSKTMKKAGNLPTRIPVDLDRRRYFQLDLAAVVRWEANTGKPFFCHKTWKHLSKKDTALMLWTCLVKDDPELKPADIIPLSRDKKIDWDVAFEKLELAWGKLIMNSCFIGGEKI